MIVFGQRAQQVRAPKHIPVPPNMALGVGPGRCGTKSLAEILNRVPGVRAEHERFPQTLENRPDVQQMIGLMAANSTEKVVHVGALWLMFVPVLRLQWPELPVICLHRHKEDTIASFMGRQRHRGRPWIINEDGKTWRLTPEFLGRHWDRCEQQMAEITDPVLHVQVGDLNNDTGLDRVFDFLNIAQDRRVYSGQRRYNRRDELLVVEVG